MRQVIFIFIIMFWNNIMAERLAFATDSDTLILEKKSIYELENKWKTWSEERQVYNVVPSELCFLYSLGNFKKEELSEVDFSAVCQKLDSLDRTQQSGDLLIYHLHEKDEFKKISSLSVFRDLDESMPAELLLIGANAHDVSGKELEADKFFDFLEKTYFENEQVSHHLIIRLVKQGQYFQAINKINSFISGANMRPKHAAFLCLKAYILFDKLKKNEEALGVINEGLILNPRSEKLLRLKLAIMTNNSEEEVLGKNILPILSELVALTNDVNLRKNLISLFVKEEEYDSALEEMTFLDSNVFENVFNKVILLLKMKREEDALLEVESAISLKPLENKELVSIKLQLLLNLERYDQLLDILFSNLKDTLRQYKMIEEFFGKEKAFELASELIIKIFKIGQASNQHENVINKLLRCKFVVNNLLFFMTLADFCFKNGFYGHAQNIYGYLEELFLKEPKILSKIYCSNAKIYLLIGNREYGLRLLKKAVLINPSLSAAWQILCEESLKDKQFIAAELFLKKAIRLNPFDHNLLFLKEQINFVRTYCL